tara:strand:- start:194 stop:328 length:135 start_codon:yes stop_codon:yes gene_type:complete
MPKKHIDLSFSKNLMKNDMTRDKGQGTRDKGQGTMTTNKNKYMK